MEEMKCTYDVFAFSPRASLLRRLICVLAHPLMLILPVAALAAAVIGPFSSEAVATAFLLGFGLILVRFFRKSIFRWLDVLARKDAKALRIRDPQRYAWIRHQLFPEPLSCRTAPNTCSVAYFRPL